jgi:proteic killer suppression protein
MIISFRGSSTEDLFDGADTGAARRTCPGHLWPAARRRLDLLNRVTALSELAIPPGNRLERLKGSRAGQYSIRINDQ